MKRFSCTFPIPGGATLAAGLLLALTHPVNAAEVHGTLGADTTWTAADSPYLLTAPVTVAAGVTLRVEPGAVVHFSKGVDLVITNGARMLAEGTAEKRIRFSRPPGRRERWGGIVIAGAVDSPETRLTHVHIEGNDFSAIYSAHGTLFLDQVTFGTRDRQFMSLDGSSFLVQHCHFQNTTGEFEPLHGTGGVKQGGRGIFRECFFGISDGYSDIIDFTGGNREKGQPVVQFYNNVFMGSTDDELDLDGTDAWVEGNIFLHSHKNGAPDTSSAVSGGDNANDTSQVTLVRNIFFDCDQAATAKEGNFFTMINNTIVHMTKEGGLDTTDGAICVRDLDPRPTTFGVGFYMEANIIVDVTQLVKNYEAKETTVTFNNNLLAMDWAGPGSGNFTGDPKFKHVPTLAETRFTNWAGAQVIRDWLSLQPDSPARGKGPNGRDLGAVVPGGVGISGEPAGTTDQRTAQLLVGFNRQGSGIPSAGWPLGAGYTHYKWRLDGGAWSPETSIEEKISLTGLKDGTHAVEVIGKRDSALYQDDPQLGEEAVVSRSKSWTVQGR